MRLPFLPLLLLATIAASPATRPTTRPSTPKQRYTLMNGSVRYAVPADFKEVLRSDDDHQAAYRSPDEKCLFHLIVSPQEIGFPVNNERAVEKLKAGVLASVRKQLETQQAQVLYGPRSETDDRFLLRIHCRYSKNGQTADDVQTYRAAGIDIICVVTQVKGDDRDEIKRYDEMGEDVCLSLTVGPALKKKPTTAPHPASR